MGRSTTTAHPLAASDLGNGVERFLFLVGVAGVLVSGAGWVASGRDAGWATALVAALVVALFVYPLLFLFQRHRYAQATLLAPGVQHHLRQGMDMLLHAVLDDMVRAPMPGRPTSLEATWAARSDGLHLTQVFAAHGRTTLGFWKGDTLGTPSSIAVLPWPGGAAPVYARYLHAPSIDMAMAVPEVSAHQRMPLAAQASAAAQHLGLPFFDLAPYRVL